MNGSRKHGTLVASLCLAGMLAGAVQAAPPNDNWADRIVIAQLPFAHNVADIQLATNEPADPELFCVVYGRPTRGTNSVWYEFTTGPAGEYVDLAASDYDSILGVFEGSPADGYAMVRGGCNDDNEEPGVFVYSSKVYGLRLKPGTRYSIEVATYTPHADPTMNLAFSMSRSTVYAVTKTADTADGACDADCSLREAFAAQAAQPGAIVVPAGRYELGSPLVTESRGAVYGAGMDLTVIDAMGTGAVLSHTSRPRQTFALHDLTLTGGVATTRGGAFNGGEVNYYVFDRVAVRNSRGASGGGININLGIATVSMFDSVVSGNVASSNGGGGYFLVANLETVNTAIAGNQASGGLAGGLYVSPYRDVRLKNTTVSGNTAGGPGGGVYVEPDSPNARIVVNNSSIVNNATGAAASPQNGGFVLAGDDVPTAPTVVTNSVLAGNHAVHDPATIFDCGKPDAFALTTGYNLAQAPNGCAFTATGDVTAADPQLQPLTATSLPVHVPSAGSPLIDAGNPGTGCEAADARGVARPADGDADGTPRCDIGAVEWTAARDGDLIFTDGFD